MGNNLTTHEASLPFNIHDYVQFFPHKADFETSKNVRYLKSVHTGIAMEQYLLQFNDEQQYREHYDAFRWRLNQENVVNTLHFVSKNKNEFCSTVYAAYLYTQHIAIRLSDIKDIPYPDNLYVLMACFDGFNAIFQKTGYFQIQENMICINKAAKVRVWINSDLSNNYPQDNYVDDNGNQHDMVKKIIQLIDYNTDKQSQSKSIPEYFHQHEDPTFVEARLILKQYSKEYKVTIPDYFQSIQDYIDGEQNVSETHSQRVRESNRRKSVKIHRQDFDSKTDKSEFNHDLSKTKNNHIDINNNHNNSTLIIPAQSNNPFQRTIVYQPPNPVKASPTPYHQPVLSTFPSYNSQPFYPQQSQVYYQQQTVPIQFNYQHSYKPPQQQITYVQPLINRQIIPQFRQHYPAVHNVYHTMAPFVEHRPFMQSRATVQSFHNNYQQQPQVIYYPPAQNIIISPKSVEQTHQRFVSRSPTRTVKPEQQTSKDSFHLHNNKSTKVMTQTQQNTYKQYQHIKNNSTAKKGQNIKKMSIDVNIFNDYENHQFKEVRNKKQQIVRSAKQILELRDRESRQARKARQINQHNSLKVFQTPQTVIYHSHNQQHEIDPEIAEDLLNMQFN